jgi:class II lanthipeptide synthase
MGVQAVDYWNQLAAAVAAVRLLSGTRFSWLGKPSGRLPRRIESSMPASAARRYLRDIVAARLYSGFYTNGGRVRDEVTDEEPVFGDASFLAALGAANGGTGPWDRGWTVAKVETGHVLAAKDGLTLLVPKANCRISEKAESLERGTEILVHYPKDLPAMSPGYYLALADRPWVVGGNQAVARVYWHLTAEGAEPFVRSLTARLNCRGIPFLLKVLDHPSRYSRCDAGVVYIARSAYEEVLPDLRATYSAVAPHLVEGVPALTKPVAPGVGFADDPPGDQSFGMHRCLLLAEGIVVAHERGLRSPTARLQSVHAAFRDAGVDPSRPYLNPGSSIDVEPLSGGPSGVT